MKTRPIPKTFDKNGYKYTLYKEGVKACMYRQKGEFFGNVVIHWETHKVRKKPVSVMLQSRPAFKGYTHYMALANNEEFGLYGWSYSDLEDAEKKFDEIEAEIEAEND